MSSQDRDGWGRLDDRAERIAGGVADRPVVSLFKLAFGLVALVFFFGLVAWGCGWVGGTAAIVSFDNFEEQHFQLQQDWESMEAVQANWCAALDAVTDAVGRGAPESTIAQRESQALAHENNYRRIQAQYDRRMANFFETMDGFVAPPELPDLAPGLGGC